MPKVLIIISLMFLVNIATGQRKLKGDYDGWQASYTFYEDGTFTMSRIVGLGEQEAYGSGHYTLTKDSLLLNYDLTPIRTRAYFISNNYYNGREDSIYIKIKLFDFKKNPLPDTTVILRIEEGESLISETNKNGEVFFTSPIKQAEDLFFWVQSDLFWYFFSFGGQISTEMEVYLANLPLNQRGRAHKNYQVKFKVKKSNKNCLELFSERTRTETLCKKKSTPKEQY